MVTNYKVILNNRVKGRVEIKYYQIDRTGPDDSPTFTFGVQVGGTTFGIGSGPSNKAAKEEAARNAVDYGDKTGAFHRLP